MKPAESPPLAAGGWSEDLLTLPGALVVPPTKSGFIQAAGVLDGDGRYCAHGALWRRGRALTIAPQPVTPETTLEGRWLWGGVLWRHFGHFLAESTARLWALDHLDAPIDGILFIPKRPRNADRMKKFQAPLFDLMGVDVPIRVATGPMRVDTLLVPGQGLGLGDISAGTAHSRTHFAANFARGIAPDGPEKLYVSRSALGVARGSILGEAYLEDRMRENGYEVFHPQAHPMEVQIARYRAARQVVASDGSALHLLAMAMPKDQKLAIVARRNSSAVDLLVRHVASFTGRDPHVVKTIRRAWFQKGRRSVKRLALGELNLKAAGQSLRAGGFIAPGEDWVNLTDDEIAAFLQETGQKWYLKPWARRSAAAEMA